MNKRRDVLHCSGRRSHNLEGVCVLACVLPRSDAMSPFQTSLALLPTSSHFNFPCTVISVARLISVDSTYRSRRLTLSHRTDRTHSEMM